MILSLWNRFTDDTAFLLESTARLMLSAMLDTAMAEHPMLKAARERLKPQMSVKDGVARIPVEGVLAHRPDVMEMAVFGVEDSRNVLDMVQSATEAKDVKAILLDIDSPGGFSVGGFEIADAVAHANTVKPTYAHISGMGASLAYMIASQAGKIIANRSSIVGSIGAYIVNVDRSKLAESRGLKVEVFKNKEAKFKAMGIPGTSLNDDQRKHITEKVQGDFDEFKSMVKTSRPGIPESAMQGQTYSGRVAKGYGAVDIVGSGNYALGMIKATANLIYNTQ